MRIFILNKPKRTILNILYIFSLLMMVISLIAAITLLLWREYPQHIAMIDKVAPSFYRLTTKHIYKKAKKSTSEQEKYKNFSLLIERLDDHINNLNSNYTHYNEAVRFVINYYINNNELQKALVLSEKVEKKFPYDFYVKFKHSKVLALIDKNKAKTYLEQLYKKHSDIREVKKNLHSFLFKNGFINEAILMNKEVKPTKFSPNFTSYFIDGNQKYFNEKQKLRLNSDFIETQDGRNYSIAFQRDFTKFKGIRLDFDGFQVDEHQFKLLSMILRTDKKEYKDIKIKRLNDITKIHDNNYAISGPDPFIVLFHPDDLESYKGVVNLNTSIALRKPGLMDKLTKNYEWQIFYSQSLAFSESQSKRFGLSFEPNNVLKADLNFDHSEKTKFIRFDLPSFDGLKIKSINVLVNNSSKISEREINKMHAIIKNKQGYAVIGRDPFIIYKLSSEETINRLLVRIQL